MQVIKINEGGLEAIAEKMSASTLWDVAEILTTFGQNRIKIHLHDIHTLALDNGIIDEDTLALLCDWTEREDLNGNQIGALFRVHDMICSALLGKPVEVPELVGREES